MKKFFRKALPLITLTLLLVISRGLAMSAYAQTGNRVLARVNSRNITQSEVDSSLVAQLYSLEQQIYVIRKSALESLILRTLLENEAKKQGKSVEELKRQLTAVRVEILPSQVEQVYAENAAAFAGMDPDEAKQRVQLDLESQARMQNYREALLRLRASASIQVLLEEPRLPSLSDNTAPSIGLTTAPVTITEFSDFLCPYCRNVQPVVREILQTYKKDVRLVFKHLPLDIHAEAFTSARAAFCAGEQGSFWKYHDALFVSESFSSTDLNKNAADQNLNMPAFKACLGSEASRNAVLKDTREAKQFGINGTPAFIVNGKLIRGVVSFEEFRTIIERELKIAQSLTTNQP